MSFARNYRSLPRCSQPMNTNTRLFDNADMLEQAGLKADRRALCRLL